MHDKPRRRWFQFSLRTVLVMLTLAAIGAGWLTYRRAEFLELSQYHRNRAAESANKLDVQKIRAGYYHLGMARRYEEAARRPWLPLALQRRSGC